MDYVFMSLLTSSVCTFLSACLLVCYKSKCSSVKGCGIEIQRNVELEEKYDELNINNKV